MLNLAAEAAVKPWWRDTIETIIWAFVLAMIIRAFIVQAFWIPSGSMIPTLEIGDRVLVAKFWNWFAAPSRGSIYVFRYPVDKERDFVKRVIALPGDTVNISNGIVYINGDPLDEPYVKNHDTFTFRRSHVFPEIPFTIPEGKYLMLGDNRPNSQDGRFWGFVSDEDLRGPVFFRYWPLNRVGIPE
ncbi:MAG: signal peptidase I [Synergistaceae bacterium]|nr:signal peptidase I [Synergistaceae bacterium]MBQ9581052.1 signal peptidase I [Synergistaceae bacterium]MBR0043474.1 signal peptidase I [Synergistaceae bacterium]MBR0222353.1 signal peptidase I [Synergistaceae bacterium]